MGKSSINHGVKNMIGLTEIGKTNSGYRVLAIAPGCRDSPMRNHGGGEIAVDDQNKVMYAWHTFVVLYGTDSVMRACNAYHRKVQS
jgi:hypothetical protein